MNTFKRKSLCVALASAGALGVAATAQAVIVNPNGLGSVLIYPYYTVNNDKPGNAFNSLLSVVNTSDSVTAVKVRFLEGKDSREVLDFNLFLSPYDVWTAGIVPTLAGAKLITFDKSCTIPSIPSGGVDFVNFAYVGSNSDKGGDGLDRTKEGYVEIITMANFFSGSTVADGATHSGGVPSCKGVTDSNAANEVSDFIPSPGPLFGGISLIDVLSGTDYTEDAVALDSFVSANSFTTLYQPSGDVKPDLRDATPISQVLIVNPAGISGLQGVTTLFTSDWGVANGCTGATPPKGCDADAVSAVLMHNQIMNEFVLDTGTKSGTDWVATMPTKRFYINAPGTGNAPRLFQRNFNGTAGSCDDVTLFIIDREEFVAPTSFSPPPPSQTNALCWEANVVSFAGSNVLNSENTTNIPTTFQNGWLKLGFPLIPGQGLAHNLPNIATTITTVAGGSTAGNIRTYFGLPVIGFAVQSFNNGTLPGAVGPIQSSYGGNFVQKATTRIQ